MEKIRKIDNDNNEDIECDRECSNNAIVRIKTSNGTPLELCPKHRRELEEEMRDKIQEKFEGMSKEEIAEKMVEGEGIL